MLAEPGMMRRRLVSEARGVRCDRLGRLRGSRRMLSGRARFPTARHGLGPRQQALMPIDSDVHDADFAIGGFPHKDFGLLRDPASDGGIQLKVPTVVLHDVVVPDRSSALETEDVGI